MAEINTDSKDSGKKGAQKKKSTHVDFTPMVDLGFLLITFFLLATTMIKPQTMELAMPSKEKAPEGQADVKASRAVTIILDKNNEVYYWEGIEENGVRPKVIATNYSAEGIRKFLLNRNIPIRKKMRELELKNAETPMADALYDSLRLDILKEEGVAVKKSPIVVIKATDEATYRNLIDILDEMAICNIGSYAIVDINDTDKTWIEESKKAK